MANMVKCPFCEKMADSSKKNCPHCGGPLGFEYKPDESQIPTVVKDIGAVGGMKPPSPAGSSGERKCPSCGAGAKPNDIICLQCGANLLVKNQANAQIHKREASGVSPKLYLGVAAVVLLCALGGLAGFLLQGTPVEKAKALAKAGNGLDAINIIEEYLIENEKDAEAQLLLGKLLWKTQQYVQAADALEKALQLNPANTEAGMMAVAALSRDTITDQTQRQAAVLSKVVQQQPDNGQAWYLLGLCRGMLGDFSGQLEALDKATIAGNTGDDKLALYKGIAQALSGSARPALNTLELVQGLPEQDAVVGLVAHLAGQREKALASLERASKETTSMQGIVATRLGLLYLAEGNVEAAHKLFMQAAQLPNAPAAAVFFDAVSLQARGFNEEAIAAYENVMDNHKEFAHEAALQLALLYLRQDSPEQANNILKHARQLGEESAKLLTLEGQVLLMNNAPEEARERFLAAIKLDGAYPAAHLEYGLMQVSQGALREGLVELERFLSLAKKETSLPQVNEIELLVNQLKSSTDQSRAVARAAAAAGAQ